jgi:prevent-host-death family protein
MTATEAKTKFLALLAEIEDGQEFEITRHGRTVARLSPSRGPHALRGRFAGVAMSSGDDEELFTTGVTWNLE